MPLPQVDLDDIDLQEKIGRGNVTVFKATMKGKEIAVKLMDNDGDEIPREVAVHGSLPPHPNVLPLLGFAKDEDNIYVCMELADKSLHRYLHVEKKNASLEQSRNWALQIASAMCHIHQHGLAHRDLKSANVLLLQKDQITKVCDFGSAKLLQRTATATGVRGTYRWMAPEASDQLNAKVSQCCDVFSYGMVLYEIFMQQIPFYELKDVVAVTSSIRSGKRPALPPSLPPYIRVLMQACWSHKPHARPTFEVVLEVKAVNVCIWC